MKPRHLAALAAITLGLSGCAQAVMSTENALSQAGFQAQAANTPQRQAALTSLQPHKFSMQIRNGKAIWVYADPTICHCLYLGDQFAYDNYMVALQQKQQREYAEVVRMANANNEMPYPFQWEHWGPGTPYY
jgi:hypothetical protein